MSFIWTDFPGEWLKKGKNVIELFSPEAASESEGWRVHLARADEFEHGGSPLLAGVGLEPTTFGV